MAFTKLSTILSWFQTGDKPTEEQFKATWRSFWHKSEKIPVDIIEGIDNLLLKNDGNSVKIVRDFNASSDQHKTLVPTNTEISSPIEGDTAEISYTNSIIAHWAYTNDQWQYKFAVDYGKPQKLSELEDDIGIITRASNGLNIDDTSGNIKLGGSLREETFLNLIDDSDTGDLGSVSILGATSVRGTQIDVGARVSFEDINFNYSSGGVLGGISSNIEINAEGIHLTRKNIEVLLQDELIIKPSNDINNNTQNGYVLSKKNSAGATEWIELPSVDVTAPTGLETLNEGNGIGWRLIGRNANNYGNIGLNAIDLSTIISLRSNEDLGALGANSAAFNLETLALGANSSSFGCRTTSQGDVSLAAGMETIAVNFGEMAIGFWNTLSSNPQTNLPITPRQRLFVIGDGSTSAFEPREDIFSVFGKQGIVIHPKSIFNNSHPDTQVGMLRTSGAATSNNFNFEIYDGDNWLTLVNNTAALVILNEGKGNGFAIKGRNNSNYGTLGANATDLSFSNSRFDNLGATGESSFSVNTRTRAQGADSASFGNSTRADGIRSFAINNGTRAIGDSSFSAGVTTRANSLAEFSIGINPTEVTGSATIFNVNDRIFNIGNGTASFTPSDALTILKSGLITAPSLSNALIDSAGGDVLITKDWLLANNLPTQTTVFTGGIINNTSIVDLNDNNLIFEGNKQSNSDFIINNAQAFTLNSDVSTVTTQGNYHVSSFGNMTLFSQGFTNLVGSGLSLQSNGATNGLFLHTDAGSIVLNVTDGTNRINYLATQPVNSHRAWRYNNSTDTEILVDDDFSIPTKKYVDDAIAKTSSSSIFTKSFKYNNTSNPLPDSIEQTLLFSPSASQYISVKKITAIMDVNNGALELANAYFYYESTDPFSSNNVINSIGGSGGLEVQEVDGLPLENTPSNIKQGKSLKAFYASGFSGEDYYIKIDIQFTIENI